MKKFPAFFFLLSWAALAAILPAGSAEVSAYSVVFYSGRGENKDIYILHPGEREPRNLTCHPAQDLCPAASPDGERIAFLSDRDGNVDIFSMRIDGSDVRQLTATPENEEHPEYAPNGKCILFVKDFDKRAEIWVMDADGKNPKRLTGSDARDERPFLSPDGSKIIFMSNRDGNYEIYTMAADGSGQARLTNTPGWEIFPTWSPDGKEIAYARKFRSDGCMQGMIRVMNADGGNDRALTAVETRDENAMWSPDGRSIVFQSVRDGNFEVYRVNRDGSDPVRLTHDPAWDGWASFVASRAGGQTAPAPRGGIAIATFVSAPEQERAVQALIRSVRERGGNDKDCRIFVVTTDPERLPCTSLAQEGVEVLPLEMERAFLAHPLALKAFAAAQVEKKVKANTGTLVWLDPGVIVLRSLAALVPGGDFSVTARPVTLANTIGIPPRSEPNDYWKPIYEETGLDARKLPALTTIADEVQIQPYYNCEVFSFDPGLGIAAEWARLLTRLLKDGDYQKNVCADSLRKLFLHQAVLSAVISARVMPERIKALPLASSYPFSQHDRLPAAKKAAALDDLAVVIFDDSWRRDPAWLGRMSVTEPLKSWLAEACAAYLGAAPKGK